LVREHTIEILPAMIKKISITKIGSRHILVPPSSKNIAECGVKINDYSETQALSLKWKIIMKNSKDMLGKIIYEATNPFR
jgi:hypothetical protein